MSKELLPAVVLEPKIPATGSVVWLHGLGADGNDFVPIVPHLPLNENGFRVILPHAPSIPVSINDGFVMPAWYDIKEADLDRSHDEAGIRRSAAQIESLIRAEQEKGIPPKRIILAGFSQGGAIALHLGLRYPEKLAGIVALSTYLVLADKLDSEISAGNRATPIFAAHGSLDPIVPIDRGQASTAWLKNNGYKVEWHDYSMQHAVCEDEIRDLAIWMTSLIAGADRPAS